MAKDNIEYNSFISQDLNFESPITDTIDCNSQISNDLNFESPIGIESIETIYSNGIVTNAVFGETAVFDFDVIANFSGAVVFTVNWGVQIGTTIINTTLVSGVSKSLQTSIEIPLGVDASQTINVTDSLGGAYAVGYTVESTAPPSDYIHAYLFNNNVLDSGSVGNNQTISNGVIADIMTTDRHGNNNSAMRSNNTSIHLDLDSPINFQKGWSVNWWHLIDGGGTELVFIFNTFFSRFLRFTGGNKTITWRPNVGTTASVVCNDAQEDVWQNFHINYDNGVMEVFINNVSQGTASNTDHTNPLDIRHVGSVNTISSIDTSIDNVKIFDYLLDSDQRQAIADS